MSDFHVRPYGRQLAQDRRSVLTVFDAASGEKHSVFTTERLIEAPNWTPDGRHLIFNAGGELWRIPAAGGIPEPINIGGLSDLNNDHVLSPDGRHIYVSSDDGHIYRLGLSGAETQIVSNIHETPFRYYLHGISPDEAELAYVAIEGTGPRARRNIFTIPARGGPDRRLTDTDKANDGPEFSPDGRWIYFNSEMASIMDGHAQIFRMRTDGSGVEQLTFDDRVNWFPHVSPDGTSIVYLSYPPSTLGHPADKDVLLRLMMADGRAGIDLVRFDGGQGSLNVNSWGPDSRRFAYVEYPLRT